MAIADPEKNTNQNSNAGPKKADRRKSSHRGATPRNGDGKQNSNRRHSKKDVRKGNEPTTSREQRVKNKETAVELHGRDVRTTITQTPVFECADVRARSKIDLLTKENAQLRKDIDQMKEKVKEVDRLKEIVSVLQKKFNAGRAAEAVRDWNETSPAASQTRPETETSLLKNEEEIINIKPEVPKMSWADMAKKTATTNAPVVKPDNNSKGGSSCCPSVKHSLLLFSEGDGPRDWREDRPFVVRGDLVARVFRAALTRGCFDKFYIAFMSQDIYSVEVVPEVMGMKKSLEGDILKTLKKTIQQISLDDLPNEIMFLHEKGQYLSQATFVGAPKSYLFAVGGKDDPQDSHPELVEKLMTRYKSYCGGECPLVSLGEKSMLASEVVLRLPSIPLLNGLQRPPDSAVCTKPKLYIVDAIEFPKTEYAFLNSGLNSVVLYLTQCGHGRNENVALYVKFTSLPPDRNFLLHRPSLPKGATAPSSFGLWNYILCQNETPEGERARGRFQKKRKSECLEYLRKHTKYQDWETIVIPPADLKKVWFLPEGI